jgi:dolichol-phosphate mannosyltransferase
LGIEDGRRMFKVLIVIPTFNESESIAQLIQRIIKMRDVVSNQYHLDVLVVDDNSPDGTADFVNDDKYQNVFVLSQDTKKGLASAYLAGFQWGLARDYDFFMQMDGDLSHQPEQIPQFLALSSTKNLVIGTRWMAGGQVVNWPKRRRYISKFGTRYAAFILKLPFKDLTSGYRVLPKQLLKRLDLNRIETQGYSFQIEIIMKAVNLGFAIKEVPITFVERANGKSKMSPGIIWEAGYRVQIWGFRRIFNRR